jgi:hypothetical protein
MTDRNGVAIGDRLLVPREFNHEYYLMLGTVLEIKEDTDDENDTLDIYYKVRLPQGDIVEVNEVDVMGQVVSGVPYLLIRYFVLDFANYEGYESNEGKLEEFKPPKTTSLGLPTLPTPKNERFIEFHSYTIDELLDAYNRYSALKDDVYFATVLKLEIIPELKKRGGAY